MTVIVWVFWGRAQARPGRKCKSLGGNRIVTQVFLGPADRTVTQILSPLPPDKKRCPFSFTFVLGVLFLSFVCFLCSFPLLRVFGIHFRERIFGFGVLLRSCVFGWLSPMISFIFLWFFCSQFLSCQVLFFLVCFSRLRVWDVDIAVCFCLFFKRDSSGLTGHPPHTPVRFLFSCLFLFLPLPRLFVRPFWPCVPPFLVFFFRGAILGPGRFVDSLGTLLRRFSGTRGGKGVLVDSLFVVCVLPLLWCLRPHTFLAAQVGARRRSGGESRWSRLHAGEVPPRASASRAGTQTPSCSVSRGPFVLGRGRLWSAPNVFTRTFCFLGFFFSLTLSQSPWGSA